MTDQAKATVWQATWKPWGEPHAISGTIPNNIRFPGQYFQLETTLQYNWHRHYDPVTGRYTQPDPLRFVDGPSIYAYAGNSPYMYTDREGLQSAQQFISANCKGSIMSVFPKQFLSCTLDEIKSCAADGDAAARTAMKLLSRKEYRK